MSQRELFSPIEPYVKGMMQVDELHTLYWEECGNPEGTPVVFLHGGPGAGATPTHRRFFDPKAYRIIIFDQRGAGRSQPLGETRQNTTELLIADIERLRRERGVARWHVFGGSWGSTLAIAYAETHPETCITLTLRGICLMQQRELDWFLYGIRNVFPEAWNIFSGHIPEQERHDLLGAYNRRFADSDENRRLQAIRIWANFESACSVLIPDSDAGSPMNDDRHRIGLAVIEAHYFSNNLFTPDAKLLNDVGRIRHIPAVIVQGRYDMVCPIITADELHRVWPEAEYHIIPDAGHSALEPGIRSALIEATEKFKTFTA
jgi:proline iminopeptidase